MNKEIDQNIILIDGSRENEHRIAIVNQQDGRLCDYDEEMESQKVLKGNVYLAKITRVEPSLQAAFVDYGDQKSGFLPFGEIHPDYYQLPVETRAMLLSEREKLRYKMEDTDNILPDNFLRVNVTQNPKRKGTEAYLRFERYINDATIHDNLKAGVLRSDIRQDMKHGYISLYQRIENVTMDERSIKTYYNFLYRLIHQHRFKIQEVIKPEQVVLVQVIKDVRGNKGVFLSTYLSVPGRYCVLLPNSGKRISFSRKMARVSERNRLKAIVEEANIPENVGVILRSSSATCRKKDLSRDLSYQLSLWSKIRERTLKSHAPSLIHEEDNHIKRALRDMYDETINMVVVQGNFAYNQAKAAIRQMMPSKIDTVKLHTDTCPLFVKYNIQDKVKNIYQSVVTLPSGGYIVIQPTEAMVSVDVNSGKFTKERNVEETALNTNLEAASEIALQSRLRDLSGLIVVDFIDMKHSTHHYEIEHHLKERLKTDRARVQVGHIDRNFGLLVFSRQRLKSSIHDNVTTPCDTCQGRGAVFTPDFCASLLVHEMNEYLDRYRQATKVCMDVVMMEYLSHAILNKYRDWIHQLSQYKNFEITFRCENHIKMENGYQINVSDVDYGNTKPSRTSEDQTVPAKNKSGRSHSSENVKSEQFNNKNGRQNQNAQQDRQDRNKVHNNGNRTSVKSNYQHAKRVNHSIKSTKRADSGNQARDIQTKKHQNGDERIIPTARSRSNRSNQAENKQKMKNKKNVTNQNRTLDF